MYASLPITEWALEDRPREKLLQRGVEALTDAELVAILLGSGTRSLSAIDLGRAVLDQVGGLDGLARASARQLTRVKGIGPAKAITLVAGFELARRRSAGEERKPSFSSSAAAARYLTPILADKEQEVFYVLFLNRNNEIIAEKTLFHGGVSSTIIDPKIVYREAVQYLASALIVAHNHPSGNAKPSNADREITQKLARAGNLFDITLLDHIIISQNGYFSFAEKDEMPGGS